MGRAYCAGLMLLLVGCGDDASVCPLSECASGLGSRFVFASDEQRTGLLTEPGLYVADFRAGDEQGWCALTVTHWREIIREGCSSERFGLADRGLTVGGAAMEIEISLAKDGVVIAETAYSTHYSMSFDHCGHLCFESKDDFVFPVPDEYLTPIP